MSMSIAIFGSGGVGGFFGACLAQAGEAVTFLARGEHLAAMQGHGLAVKSPEGDFHLQPVHATDDPAAVGPVDLVLVGVKAWQVPEAARAMQPLVGEETAVLPLQNGVEAPDQLAEVLGARAVLGGMCKIISRLDGPGQVTHVGTPPFIALGELEGGSSSRVERAAEVLRRAGIRVATPPSIRATMWEKFLFITALSGVGAVSRAPIGVVRGVAPTRALLRQAMEEVEALARALEIPVADDIVDRTLAFVDSLPAEGTSSMQRDIAAGNPSELESQNGAVVRLAEEAGVDVPVHRFLYASLLPAELQARKSSSVP